MFDVRKPLFVFAGGLTRRSGREQTPSPYLRVLRGKPSGVVHGKVHGVVGRIEEVLEVVSVAGIV
jgi:hypothetical protein